MLRDQDELFGPVASMPTAWRCLDEIDEVALRGIARARAARRTAWARMGARHGGIPPVRTCYGDLGEVIGIHLDASIVIAYSPKAQAAGTFKKTFGFHPLTSCCDNTGEALAIKLRPGNAGSNTAADPVEILDASIAQLPAKYRRRLLVSIDGAGASHGVVDHLTELSARPGYQVHYSVGFDLDARARTAIAKLPGTAWAPALDADGNPHDDADISELTGLLRRGAGGDRLASWPGDLRVIVRR